MKLGTYEFPKFDISAILYILPVAIAPAIEHVGDLVAISEAAEKDYLEKPGLHKTLLGDGIATIPANWKFPYPNDISPIPNTKITATITRFLDCDISTLFLTNDPIPIAAIIPNKRTIIPPITGMGIVFRIAPNFPKNAKAIAIIAAIVISFVSNLFNNATAPVTSEYVVFGGPPKNEARIVAIPSPRSVLCKPGFSK